MTGPSNPTSSHPPGLNRRQFAAAAIATAMAPSVARAAAWERDALSYIESLRREDGGYAWPDEPHSALNPTFGAIGCYHLFGEEPPRREALLEFVRDAPYPWPESRRTDRPLRGFEYEQAQSLAWLGVAAGFLKAAATEWTQPSDFTKRYELGGNPVFGQEVASLRTRALLGIETREPEWRRYLLDRQRDNGTFNNTPASDGSGGHVMNTLWGLIALEIAGLEPAAPDATVEWLRRCQQHGGGFTYAPDAEIGAVPTAVYTWCTLEALRRLGASPGDREGCIRFLSSLADPGGGFSDKPGTAPDPVSTWRAAEAFRLLDAEPAHRPVKQARRASIPSALRAFTIQFEGPGSGSPADAVELARALRIHLWGAKNSEAGWIGRAQEIADQRDVPVVFFPSNEEYGTYVTVPGLGTYSHLADVYAPPNTDFGQRVGDRHSPGVAPWTRFRDQRIAALNRAGGGIIWQFNENEELTRVLLDEAVEGETYDAISSFHFGRENFLLTQPFLNIYRSQLPFVGLQDNHAAEPWWSSKFLAGFRTIFLAEEPTWEGWKEALHRQWVVSVRRDFATDFEEQLAGGSNGVRREILRRRHEWDWEDRMPAATVQVVRPGDPFEDPRPEAGVMIRVRTQHEHTNHGVLREPVYEFEGLRVDGVAVAAEESVRESTRGGLSDRYHAATLKNLDAGEHDATVRIRHEPSGRITTVAVRWSP